MNANIRLPKSVIPVERPDHPFSVDGPDLLLSSPSGLMAVFTLRKIEAVNQHHLLSRLINTILVYPPFTQRVLFLQNAALPIDNSVITSGFNRIIERNDFRISNKILQDRPSGERIKALGSIQQRLFRIYAEKEASNLDYLKRVAYKFAKSNVLLENRLKEKASFYSPLSQKSVKSRSTIFEYDQNIIAVKRLSSRRSDMVELKPFFEFSFFKEFDFQEGVPHLGQMSKKIMNLDKIPSSQHDPLKPVRIASLLGWSIANANNLQHALAFA